MPKKPRQAHIPSQIRKRKVRRDGGVAYRDDYLLPETDVAAASPIGGLAQPPAGPVPMSEPAPRRMGRRMEARMAATAPVRATGQLPVYERKFLVNELRQIAITATSLLGLIVVLTVLLR